MDEKRRKDIAGRIEHLASRFDLRGKSVLEVGSDWHGVAAEVLLDAGAASVVCSNITPRWPEFERNGAKTRARADAMRLASVFEANSFDLVFGIAVLEHIQGIAEFLEQAAKVLKPQGVFYGHGGPIWSCAGGHHVWVDCEDRHYHFSDPTNPIGPWRHLVNDAASLEAELAAAGIPAEHARRIARYVYVDDFINRVSYARMKEIVRRGPLETMEVRETSFRAPPPELLEQIERGPFGGQGRYDVTGLTFVLRNAR